MRRAVLLVAVIASIAVAFWSIATTRPAGTGTVVEHAISQGSATSVDADGASASSVSGADTTELSLPSSPTSPSVQAERQPSRPLLGGLAAAMAILLGLGLVRPAVAGRRPPARHRIGRSLTPFSVAVLRGPPSVTARLLTT